MLIKKSNNDIVVYFDRAREMLRQTVSIKLDNEIAIKLLDSQKITNSLGLNEEVKQHDTINGKIRKEYYRRIDLILKFKFASKILIEGINTLRLPVVQYTFNIIIWNLTEHRRLDRKTRKIEKY